MLFNSLTFLFIFLPITFAGYFLLTKFTGAKSATAWLVLASLFFYSFWNPIYLPLILGSLLVNFIIGRSLTNENNNNKKLYVTLGIFFNLLLLGYFKYTDFFIENINTLTSFDFSLQGVVLPLAISFFTFQQIAYLVDSFRGLTKKYSILNYALFVTFFPQLISGPIVHYKEMMPQFLSLANKTINFRNIGTGLFILSLGLFKKVVIADTFAVWANTGFDSNLPLTFFEAWATALAYTFQLYFDFSGYTDMAIGVAMMFNIMLPINFNSPYKALNIQDFWRRWHITLTRFLRDYIYIPLGGSRKGATRARMNFIAVFLIGGLWHGAAWTFIVWGAMHGIAMTIHDLWKRYAFITLPSPISWLITFVFVVFAWVVFRAETFTSAILVWKGMLGFHGVSISARLLSIIPSFGGLFQFGGFFKYLQMSYTWTSPVVFTSLLITLLTVVFARNSIELSKFFKPNYLFFFLTLVLMISGLYMMNSVSEFIYFNF
jgi:alginate O-acetyltransferase complex protein AlgI